MWKWFVRRRATAAATAARDALKGVPAHARVKTFPAETGFVYQYVYRGYRRIGDGTGEEYVFDASSDRKQNFQVSVHLLDEEIARCVGAIGRELIGAERYAVVKMSLFQALDHASDVSEFEHPIVPTGAELEAHLRDLGRI